jgi:hypothetical protein
MAVDIQTAHPANPFPAVVVKGNCILPLLHELTVEHIDHFQKRHVDRNVIALIRFELTFRQLVLLAPNIQRNLHVVGVNVLKR